MTEATSGGVVSVPLPGRAASPPPAPALVHEGSPVVEVVAAGGRAVAVTGRGLVSAAPQRVSLAGGPWTEVLSWAGPWPVDERWWNSATHRRRARIQVVTATVRRTFSPSAAAAGPLEATYD